MHSKDGIMPSLVNSAAQLCDLYPQVHFIVNLFDAERVDAAALVRLNSGNHSRVEGVWVHGMKTLFWKRTLTPELIRRYGVEVVFLVDSDIAMHPSVYPLGQLVGVMAATRATLLQPSIRAYVHGTYHTFLRVRNAHMSCLATTAQFVELQTPLFTGEGWTAFHTEMLSAIEDEHLGDSDYGIDITWCAMMRAAFPGRPTCLVTPGEAATHLNTHAIEKFMDKVSCSAVPAHSAP